MQQIKEALEQLRQGKMIILVDDASRENEGDLVLAAQYATPSSINFMMQFARGVVCLALAGDRLDGLGIPMMVSNNQARFSTPFTVSIEAATGVTTGVSASDRARTIAVVMDDDATIEDIVMPGHVFPLRAKDNGVFEREGHTEGSVDLMKLAGLKPGAVICEIVREDGEMARGKDLEEFAKVHDLPIISIAQIKQYRMQHERGVKKVSQATLPLEGLGEFVMRVYEDKVKNEEYIVLQRENRPGAIPLVRIHSQCLTGDVFGSTRCDCGSQLQTSLMRIAQEGGLLIYLPQEGRGIGLANKVKAYALQEQGWDTVEANHQLGFLDDLRTYEMAQYILHDLKIEKIALLTNNPKKIAALQQAGIDVTRVPLESAITQHNARYLTTKRDKLGHLLNLARQGAAHESD